MVAHTFKHVHMNNTHWHVLFITGRCCTAASNALLSSSRTPIVYQIALQSQQTDSYTCMYTQTDRQTDRQTNKLITCTHTPHMHTHRETDRQTNRACTHTPHMHRQTIHNRAFQHSRTTVPFIITTHQYGVNCKRTLIAD